MEGLGHECLGPRLVQGWVLFGHEGNEAPEVDHQGLLVDLAVKHCVAAVLVLSRPVEEEADQQFIDNLVAEGCVEEPDLLGKEVAGHVGSDLLVSDGGQQLAKDHHDGVDVEVLLELDGLGKHEPVDVEELVEGLVEFLLVEVVEEQRVLVEAQKCRQQDVGLDDEVAHAAGVEVDCRAAVLDERVEPVQQQDEQFKAEGALDLHEDVLAIADQADQQDIADSDQMRVILFLPDEVVEGYVGWHYLFQVIFVHYQHVLGRNEERFLLQSQHFLRFVDLSTSQEIVSCYLEGRLSLQKVTIVSCM
jgi:hypothetical protein